VKSMWTDKVKAVVTVIGFLLLCFLVWQWQKPKIDPEDYAKTLAAKQVAEEQNKKYEAEKKAGLVKMGALEKDKAILAETSKAKDKKIISLERFNDELLKAKCAEATEEISAAYGNLWEAKKASDEMGANCELRLNAMTDLYKKCDTKEKSTSELLAIQIQETKDCQEKGMDDGWGVYAGGGLGAMSVDGEIKSGWVISISIGKRILKLPRIF